MLVHETAATAEADSVSPLTLHLFGPFEVRLHGQPLPHVRTRKGQWLLALLTLRHGGEVDRAWLAGTLWPDSSEAAAYASLRSSLKDLRRALGEEAGRLRSPTPRTLSLDLEAADADVVAFDQAIAQGDEAALERAVSLYRGPLLEECAEEWALPERQAREQACLTALETLAAGALSRGDPAAAQQHLRRAAAIDPLRETAQRALMQALATGGNTAAATQVYRELRLRLHRDLNVGPDPETQALYEQLRSEARAKGDREAAPGAGAHPLAPSPRPSVAPSLRAGTVTFLFTDIEGSSQLWERYPAAMRAAVDGHDALLRRAIELHEGIVFKTVGDAFYAAFATAPAAIAAALSAQQVLLAQDWGDTGPLRVRMALHTGIADERDGDYFGPTLNRVAHLIEAGHGGQVLLSLPTEELVRDELPEGTSLRHLGEHRLKDLVRPEQVFQLVHPDLPADFPPLRSLEAFAHNLPVQLTSFVGREREIAAVKRLLVSTHLLTLTGAGGCGKTRLALQIAAELVAEYGDGVWLVELAALSDPGLVPQTVAAALGVREQPHRPLTATLADRLRSRTLLLVLDNCEHLVSACAGLAETLLRSCPRLRILATSREGLHITGERTYRLPPLSLPDLNRLPPVEMLTQSEAVQLFVERALAALPSFTLTDQNAAAVAQVCHRLDGIPLAIELSASRVKALPVQKMPERLDHRFRLLTGGSRTALPRHQTLRATIDWSYDLLSEPERALLRRLSVFPGGWTLEAAEAICSGGEIVEWAMLDLLTALVEKSLVQYEERGGEARYRLLETVRQYTGDRLLATGEVDEVRGRHREFFLQLAERAAPELQRAEQSVWLDRLELEHDNLRAALECGQATEDGAASPRSGWTELRLAGALWWFWVKRGYFSEGRQRVEGALSRGKEAPVPARVKALQAAGVLTDFQGDSDQSSGKFFEEALALARAAGDQWGVAFSLFGLGTSATASRQGCEQATALMEESLALARETEDRWLIAHPLLNLGMLAEFRGDIARATARFDEMLALCRDVGDAWLLAIALGHVARMTDYQGDHERARALYKEGLALNRRLEDKRGILWCLRGLADVAAVQQQAERAARLWGAAEALREATNNPLEAFWHASHARNVAAARAALGEEAFAAAWEAGRAMPLEGILAYALRDSGGDAPGGAE